MHDKRARRNIPQQSIKSFSKSFILNYLLFNKPVDEHLILNSRRYAEILEEESRKEEEESRQIAKIDEKFPIAQFEHKSERSGLHMTHRLNTLTFIKDQDLMSWRVCFNEVSRICNWSEEIRMEVLSQIVDIDIQLQLKNPLNSDDILQKIMKMKYNSNNAYIYQNKLSKLKQADFYSIRAYVSEIRKNCEKIGICLDWNNVMVRDKIEEIFFTGLDDKVKFELVRCTTRTFEHCFQVLLDMESLCLDKIRGYIEKSKDVNVINPMKREKYNVDNKNTTRNNRKYTIEKHRKQMSPKKFCDFYKSRSHYNEECRASKYKSDSSKEDRSYAIREPTSSPKILEIPIKIQDKTIPSMIDTGSVKNYLPEHLARTYGFQIIKLAEEKQVKLANRYTLNIKHYCDLDFQVLYDNNTTYKSSFLLFPNTNNTCILGMRFLGENDAIINLKEGLINLDGTEYEMAVKTRINNLSDSKLIDKSKILLVKDNDEIKEMINTYKRKNPKLSSIENCKHKIELTKEFVNQPKEYPVPIGLQDNVKEHLDELIRFGIIEEKTCDKISPAFIIKKKNGKLRLVVDYRYLNSNTKKVHNITPNLKEILAKLKGASVFSTIDLNNGYYQIRIDEKDVDKTGFAIMNKTYVFKRMPFVCATHHRHSKR
ncbi:Retrovirus-related Pol polyprotein from transposon opus [Dictyocoela muelleri]|nr:Retrovirus-related Pol polyprotein from transposon opus [Dictyocoela muelleri]